MRHAAFLIGCALAFLLLFFANAGAAMSQAEILDVRLGQWPDRSRLVIETDRAIEFQLRSAGPGDEVIVRLRGLAAGPLESALAAALPDDHALIAAAAVDGGAQDRARLTLRLHRGAVVNPFALKPDNGFGHRLVLDIMAVAHEPKTAPETKPEAALVPTGPPAPAGGPRRQSDPDPEAAPAAPELYWLETTLNQQRRRRTVLAKKTGAALYLAAGDLEHWHLRLPAVADREADGERWFALEGLGIDYMLDTRRLTLEMTAPPGLFEGHAMAAGRRARIEPTPPPPGAFFNYDLAATRAGGTTTGSGLFELGAFNGWGTGTTSALARGGGNLRDEGLVRLETTWRRDHPLRMRTLTLGDTITRGTAWSGAVRYGGVQWGNNFELQPELITLPLFSMAGVAALPSTVEVYVNDALRLRQDVEPGPFDIDEIPAVTGSGQATLVVTDMLGRQQVITQDFYSSRRVLRAGLHDWSWEIGAERENFGLEDFDYGRGFVAITHRYGLTNRLTGEIHAQHGEDHTTAGAGAAWLVPFGGVLHAASAFSRGDDGSGRFHSLGVQRQGWRFSGGFEGQFASREFTRLGLAGDRSLPSRQLRAFASLRAFSRGTLSLSYTEQRHRERHDIEFITLRLTQRVGGFGFLNLSAAHFFDSGDQAFAASLTIPLARPRTSASFGASTRDGRSFGTAALRRNLPVGTGYGYNLQARLGDGDFQRGALAYQNDYGTWRAEASHRGGDTAFRGQAAGGMAWLAGELFAARRIRDSFGVVQVPGFEGVRVYAENQEVGRTNARGNALVPRLRPYQRNRLRIEQADLPLGANIDGLEAEVAPYWRSGVVVPFPVVRTRDAFFRILLEDGEPLPLGAAIYDERGEVWPVGHRGETFITGLSEHNHFHVRHNGERCEFELSVPETDEPLPDLGSVVCRELGP